MACVPGRPPRVACRSSHACANGPKVGTATTGGGAAALKHAQVDLGELQPDLRRKELGFFLWPDTLGLAATAIVYEDPPGADTVCR